MMKPQGVKLPNNWRLIEQPGMLEVQLDHPIWKLADIIYTPLVTERWYTDSHGNAKAVSITIWCNGNARITTFLVEPDGGDNA